MLGCKCMIYQRVNYVLDRLQFLESSITNDLRDDQILTLRCVNSSAFQAMAACGEHGWVVVNDVQSVINDTAKTTWVKGYQLSRIGVQWRPEWRVASYQWYAISIMTTGVVNDRCGWWPMWLMTGVVNDLWSSSNSIHHQLRWWTANRVV